MLSSVPTRRVNPRALAALREARRAAKRQEIEHKASAHGVSVAFPQKRGKFGAIPSTYNGHLYHSLDESIYASDLDLKKKAGEIIDWWIPKSFVVFDADKAADRVTYKPDFGIKVLRDGVEYVYYVDFKGSTVNKRTGKRSTPTETDAFSIRVRLWRANIPFELRVAYADGVEKVVAKAHQK